jgi:hypothetical protein
MADTTAQELNRQNITNPQMPAGGAYNPVLQTPEEGELMDSNAYQIDPNATQANTATVNQTSQAQSPQQQQAATYDATTVQNAPQMQAAQGQVSQGAQVQAAQGTLSNETRQALDQAGNQITDADFDPRSLVRTQYEDLTNFDPANPPGWARGAIRLAQSKMAARGLGDSTMMGDAVTGAVLQAALPIAVQDAAVFKSFMDKKLDARTQATLMKASLLAQVDMANLNNRQQAQVENAKAFLALDLKNLDNRQQTALVNTQSQIQTLLSNQAAENAAKQFNATSENQVNQFYDALSSQVSMYNASQVNNMAQFNTGQINAMSQFNSQMANQREMFNTQNAIVIDQANVNYLRQINTRNTQLLNQANYVNAQSLLNISNTAMANELLRIRDEAAFAFQASENEKNRAANISMAYINRDINMQYLDYQSSAALASTVGRVATGILNNWDAIFG